PEILNYFEDPAILKLTHAGENDYRIFYNQFGIIPQNVFDTQLAAGFIGYKYPTSFQKLVEKELGVFVPKGYTVSDWKSRPFNGKQIKYALNDVIYLHGLWQSITSKLREMNRESWAKEECEKIAKEAYYQINPYKDAFNNNAIANLNVQEQIFMIRLYEWRRSEAERKNYSKEMIMSNKMITPIVKNIRSGKNALLKDRRLPTNMITKNWDTFNELFNRKITDDERAILRQIPDQKESPDPKQNTMLEMLYSILQYLCQKNLVAPSLVLSRTSFKLMKSDPEYFDESITKGWRASLIGKDLLHWLRVRKDLIIEMKDGQCVIRMEE
ncbi:MAG: ribonuclease D, partial [Bacteroidota bacterium]